MLDAYLEYYTGIMGMVRRAPTVEKDGKTLQKSLKENRIYQVRENEYRLTINEKQRILQEHIYGVDIDRQAVEVTKLSLLLKLLEGENRESTGYLFKYSDIKLLPNLSDNIKCGNSLIGSDFYDSLQKDLFADEELTRRLNVFDWNTSFPEVFHNGGFDIVIGNPPYVRQEGLGEYKEYFSTYYRVYHGVADLYAYFIEKGISLLRKDGLFGIIVANKWMRAGYGEPLRRFLKSKEILEIVDFGDLPVFEKATTYPCILRVKNHDRKNISRDRSRPDNSLDAVNMKTLLFGDLSAYVEANKFKINIAQLEDAGWALAGADAQALLQKLKGMIESRRAVTLGEYVNGKIFYGIKTGLNEAFVIDQATKKRLIKEDPKSKEIIKPFLAGRDIKRYYCEGNKYLILFPKGWTNEHAPKAKFSWEWLQNEYPSIASHLSPFLNASQNRCDKGDYWWELRACDYYSEFEKPKIIYAEIAINGQFTIEKNNFYSDTTSYILGTDSRYLLGILNSKLWNFMFSKISSEIRGGFFRWKKQYMENLPIYSIDFSKSKKKIIHDQIIKLVEVMLDLQKKYHDSRLESEKNMFEKQIEILDQKIDRLVYELYGLTEDEIKIVEKKDA